MGNVTSSPHPASPASSATATYDAWNRLVEHQSPGGVVTTYEYDGLGRRIIKSTPGGDTRHFFYSNEWQVLEERVDERTNDVERQHVWSCATGIRRMTGRGREW